MKFLFIVQGEGRGHMTQAMSLFDILKKNGHEITHVVIGKSKRRQLPDFFVKNISAPITQLESPNFVTDKKAKSVNITRTILVNLSRIRVFHKSIQKLDTIVKSDQPDAIINFYDFLGGFYFMLKKPQVKHLAIAHQFLLSHTDFTFPKGRIYDQWSLRIGNRLAGYGASKKLCLSFQPMTDEPKKKLNIVPPLLREEIKNTSPSQKDHFLVYMVNHGYSEQVMHFHQQHPSIPLHCFWDKKGMPEEHKVDDTLTFHQLDDKKFINFMASCRGYLTTAGFESVCEAMYFGKPVLMVPVEGHYEQACNAVDAEKAGAGISSNQFDLNLLLDYIPKHKTVKSDFHSWCALTEEKLLNHLVHDH
ncbi:MAG: glycosyltransferase family protein [Ekhidna sp.]